MGRLHLFEFGDQGWLPAPFRDAMTSYLRTAYGMTPFPRLWAERLAFLLRDFRDHKIVDLGSGAAGPAPRILVELAKHGLAPHVTLTDLHPNRSSLNPQTAMRSLLTYWPDPVDAVHVPDTLSGILTLFTVFHHFSPDQAHSILKNAFEQRRPICVFEGTSRTPGAIASALLIPLLALLLTPVIRPISWPQIVFTYLLPILPLLMFWDGLVSHLRTYSVEELTNLTSDLRSPDYTWEIDLMRVPACPAAPRI
jgi:hypothetical protein